VHGAEPGGIIRAVTALDAAPPRIAKLLLVIHAATAVIVRLAQAVEDSEPRAPGTAALTASVLDRPLILIVLTAQAAGVRLVRASLC